MSIDVSLEELLEAGAHFGHQARRWNPKMSPFLYGVKEGVHVFDLVKTREALVEALDAITKAVREGKTVLLIATKKQIKAKVAQMGQNTGILYVNERWLGGTLTNFDQIMRSVRKLHDLKKGLETGEFASFTKKERLLIERQVVELEQMFGGIQTMNKLPELLIIVDIHKEKGAVLEARSMGIPVVGVVDSNSDPSLVEYPIPMNDDAARALEFIVSMFERAILEGKTPQKTKAREKKEKKVAKSKKKSTKKANNGKNNS